MTEPGYLTTGWHPGEVPVTMCVGCGCTNDRACMDGGLPCHWIAVENEEMPSSLLSVPGTIAGICSVCAAKPLEELIR
jgi:hypothetical protein